MVTLPLRQEDSLILLVKTMEKEGAVEGQDFERAPAPPTREWKVDQRVKRGRTVKGWNNI